MNISSSYPLLSLARSHGLSYASMLGFAEYATSGAPPGFVTRRWAAAVEDVAARGLETTLRLELSMLLDSGVVYHPSRRKAKMGYV